MARALLAAAALRASTSAPAPFNVSQYNMTITLSSAPTAMGRYISGDYWVVGPVTILATDPPATGGRNGFEVSPASTLRQPYDARAAGYDASLQPALPRVVAPGSSVVKAASGGTWPGSNPTYLAAAMVLTVVAAPPPAGAYRPPYFRNSSAAAALAFNAAQLRWDLYPSLPLPPAPKCPPAPAALCAPPPPLADAVARRYAMPQIDHLNGFSGATIHPIANMPGAHYGEAIVQDAGLAAARLLLNDASAADKAAAAHGLVQYVRGRAPLRPLAAPATATRTNSNRPTCPRHNPHLPAPARPETDRASTLAASSPAAASGRPMAAGKTAASSCSRSRRSLSARRT